MDKTRLKEYNTTPFLDNEGTFRKSKLPNQKMIDRVGYHLNVYTYEIEECN